MMSRKIWKAARSKPWSQCRRDVPKLHYYSGWTKIL